MTLLGELERAYRREKERTLCDEHAELEALAREQERRLAERDAEDRQVATTAFETELPA